MLLLHGILLIMKINHKFPNSHFFLMYFTVLLECVQQPYNCFPYQRHWSEVQISRLSSFIIQTHRQCPIHSDTTQRHCTGVWSHLCADTWCEKSSVRELSRVVRIKGDLPRHETLVRIWMRHVVPPTNPMLKWTVLWARKSTGWLYCNSIVPWHQTHLPFDLVIS